MSGWFAPVPAERLAAFRILVGLYSLVDLAVRTPLLVGYASFPATEFHPVGVVRVLDAPLPPAVASALVLAALALAVPFLLGWRHAITGPAFALLLLWVTSYRNSWGMVFHTENLAVLHVACLALAPAADAWSLDARRRGSTPAPDGRYGWALRLACALTVITYVIAGVAKLRLAGLDWIAGEELRNQIAYDNLRRAVHGATPSPLAIPLLAHPAVFTAFAALTMAVELGAPLAFLHRRVAAAWALLAWGFHVGVLALMHILFPYPLAGVAYAPFFELERPLGRIATAARRYRRARSRRRPGTGR